MTDEASDGLEEHRLTAVRLAKLDAMRAAGVDPYPVRFEPTATAAALVADHGEIGPGDETGVTATVAGRLMAYM